MRNSADNHSAAGAIGEDYSKEIPTAATHTPAQERRHLIVLFVVIALLGCLYPALKGAPYKGDASFHATIEMAGALVGLIAGLALVMRFYALGNRFYLFIGLAFFVNGAEDLVHGFASLDIVHGFTGAPASSLEQFIPGTYATGRLMLGLLLLAAPFANMWAKQSEKPKRETFWVSCVAIIMTIIATAVAFKLPLPKFIYPERLLSRPVDFASAVVLFLALVAFLWEYHRTRDLLLWWILLSTGINMMGQLLMSFSKELYDPLFDISHVCKVLGYATPLLGFSIYQIAVIADSRRAEEKIAGLAKFPSEDPNPVLRIALDGTVLYANDAAAALLGELHSGVSKAAPNCWLKWIKKALASGLTKTVEFEHDARTLSFTVAPVAEGGYVNLYGRDITERKRAERDLTESEEKYRSVFEAPADAFLILTQDGIVVDANPAAREMHGYPGDEIIGMPVIQLVHPDSQHLFEEFTRSVLSTGSYHVEAQDIRKDGTPFDIDVRGAMVRYKGEDCLLGVLRDITERKKAEFALVERMKELNCRYAISRLDRAEIALSTILQKTAEIIPPGWQYPEITCARITFEDQEFKSAKFETTPWSQTSDIYVHDSCVGSVEVYYLEEKPEIDEGPFLKEERDLIDDIARYLSSIIERKEAEAALKESEERYRELFEYAHDLIFTVDTSTGLVTTMNDAAREVLSYEPGDLTNKPYSAFVSPTDLPTVQKQMEAAISDTSETVEAWCTRKDGTPVLLDLRMRSIPVPGREATLHVIAYDVTQRRRESEAAKRLGEILQQRVREKTADLEEANRHLQDTQAHLVQAEKFAALGQLAAGVAHEINNPLSFVANNLAVLRRDYRLVLDIHRLYQQMATEKDPHKRQQLAEQALARAAEVDFEYIASNLEHIFDRTADGTERIRRIVIDMRDFTRLGEAEWKETDINGALDATVTILFNEITARQIQVEKNYQDLPAVYCMPGRINQVLLNIITNAIEAVPEGGRIVLSTSPVEKGVRIAIADNGHGIPEKDLGKIFDPFFSTKPKGSGLGLSISYGIIADHKGSIEVSSTPGQGAEFVITLPLKPEEE